MCCPLTFLLRLDGHLQHGPLVPVVLGVDLGGVRCPSRRLHRHRAAVRLIQPTARRRRPSAFFACLPPAPFFAAACLRSSTDSSSLLPLLQMSKGSDPIQAPPTGIKAADTHLSSELSALARLRMAAPWPAFFLNTGFLNAHTGALAPFSSLLSSAMMMGIWSLLCFHNRTSTWG